MHPPIGAQRPQAAAKLLCNAEQAIFLKRWIAMRQRMAWPTSSRSRDTRTTAPTMVDGDAPA
ncbi:hypothetical protein ACSFA8_22865 [Variovorax sp. RT4R15]|uniref:hypothetical protein n=1 Tax=Variovorax sp. RT4R15 TaxID=3443737 RepID=UPI003F47BEE2